jgi:hypothetical protein
VEALFIRRSVIGLFRFEQRVVPWYDNPMEISATVSHDRREETPEAKARWFRSLPLSQRMEMLCAFTDLALSVNPGLQERKHAQPVAGRIQILSAN